MLEEEYEPRRLAKPFHLRRIDPPEPTFSYEIRAATAKDLPAVRQIYDHYVTNTMVTLDTERRSLRTWRSKYAYLARLGLPFLVAVSPSGQVLGYALAEPWIQKRAYRFTAEESIYLRPASTGKGLGKALLTALMEAGKQAGLKQLLAVVADSGADASLALHRSLGFTETGRMGKVAYKFDRWIGTVMLQRSLK
ncbi:GNAT family N-acetyltransferase [Amnibacterium setariae]|uniref:N-acetyltransferase family protein n=1 Tax=Amnibacterium setariae TaxID=2306585 RepID=A0A3A1UD50_9MICO|nr:GNAT family N-acetyltransferase [Amnibacterium setariae]RIX31026.1 N-acetyltransferase family protein [Amnibacterium setariae]